jgi:hypothetical protein
MLNFSKPKNLSIPFFSLYENEYGNGACFPPDDLDCQQWYRIFTNIVELKLKEKKFYPIFRLSDGEFIFMIGRKFSQYRNFKKFYEIIQHIKRSIYYGSFFYSSGRKGYCETYKFYRINKLRSIFLEYLKNIANQGMLCFNYSNHLLTSPYQQEVNNILSRNDIKLNQNNYSQYYFVSGFFLGKKMFEIYQNKKILIFTSKIENRNIKLQNNLYKLGASNVEFYYTNLNHPMYDKIEINKIRLEPDLVLIAAGVGSSNILNQLTSLRCLCVDCGFLVDALSDFKLALKRPYYVNDFYYKKKDWF